MPASGFPPLTPEAAETVQIERAGPVTTLVLNRPERLNAANTDMFARLTEALHEVDRDPDCAVVVLTGAGRAFSTGKDMKAPQDFATVEDRTRRSRRVFQTVRLLRDLPQPVIAAVRGHAVGAGFALAAACDLRVVAPDASFDPVFTDIGMTPGDLGLSFHLPRLIGAGRAAHVLYTATPILAQQAVDWGLASEIAADPRGRAQELAAGLAAKAPESLRQTKELLGAAATASSLHDHLLLEYRSQVICAETADHARAVRAFRSRRQ
jgi:enoyl-CoA hydratase